MNTKVKKSNKKLKTPKKLIMRTPKMQNARKNIAAIEIEVANAIKLRYVAYTSLVLLLRPYGLFTCRNNSKMMKKQSA